jgi:hypothetical protein
MNTKLSRLALAASLALLGQSSSWALEGVQYKVSGFGTLAGTVTDKADLEFRSSRNQSVGANSTFDFGVDSRFGVQGTVDFGQGLTVVGQALAARRRVDEAVDSNRDFDLGVEWLMAQYSVNSNLDVRLGRVVLPAFMISDSRNVTYSQPWLRAPLEVYAAMPLSTVDGVQAAWRLPVSDAVITLQPTFGKASSNTSAGTSVIKSDRQRIASLNASVEYGSWLVRVGQVRGTTPDFRLSSSLPSWGSKDKFTNFGVQFDNGSALVMAELATRRMNDVPATFPVPSMAGRPLAKSQHWYVAGGWHVGKWLPVLALSKSTDQNVSPHTSTRGLDLSVRYDLMPNVAVKAQFSRYESKDNAVFVTSTSAAANEKVNVLSAGLDFVF